MLFFSIFAKIKQPTRVIFVTDLIVKRAN